MTMGQRILAARLAAGLSQRELAGEEITRNMLSSLEHDSANPSVATLRYLSARLGKPVSWFLGEERPSEGIAAFAAGDWRRALDTMTEAEREWLGPVALLRAAEQAVCENRIPYARELLAKLDGADSPLFGPELRRCAAIARIRCGIPADIPEDDALLLKADQALSERRITDAERYLLAVDTRDAWWHRRMGECRFQAGDYPAAREHFHRCEQVCDVRARLEVCCREMEDYKMAYYYAKQ
jgi:transcriptional regulator with XRE-family HTH domain